MPQYPPITFGLYSTENPVSKSDETWNHPLPMDRHGQSGTCDKALTCGAYFESVRTYLQQRGLTALLPVVQDRRGRETAMADLTRVQIIIQKHGAFYHPAQIILSGEGFRYSFCANAAISAPGRATVQREHILLQRLNRRHSAGSLPAVFDLGSPDAADAVFPILLCEWFETFHEFHLSVDPADGHRKITLWAEGGRTPRLSPAQCAQLYHRAARILTRHFDPATSYHITSWHHAAGDFIAAAAPSGKIDLRLITVRDYSPILDTPPNQPLEPVEMLHAALLFLIDLTIRMRIDRLDGTGELVWADDLSLWATVDGFGAEIDEKTGFPFPFPDAFLAYAARFDPGALTEIATSLAGRYPLHAPERELIQKHLKSHISALHQAINRQ